MKNKTVEVKTVSFAGEGGPKGAENLPQDGYFRPSRTLNQIPTQ
jgi:hypothetical protein